MIWTLMQKTGLSDAEVCPSGPMSDKKLCKAVNFHISGSVLIPTFTILLWQCITLHVIVVLF